MTNNLDKLFTQIKARKFKRAEELGVLNLTFTEQCQWIIREIKVLSREEWMETAFMAGQGGAGFSPMGQLQRKIRHNPLTLGPDIEGIFRSPSGEVFTRVIPWPMFKKKAKEWKPQETGWVPKYDWYPYLTIDPLMDEWDRLEAEKGPDHPDTLKLIRKLLHRCLAGYHYDSVKPNRSANVYRAKRAKLLHRRPRVRPRYLHRDD